MDGKMWIVVGVKEVVAWLFQSNCVHPGPLLKCLIVTETKAMYILVFEQWEVKQAQHCCEHLHCRVVKTKRERERYQTPLFDHVACY